MGTDPAHVGLGSANVDLIYLALAGLSAGPVSPAASSVSGASNIPRAPFFGSVPADGSTIASIVVRLRDTKVNLITGKTVTLAASTGSHAVISPASEVSSSAEGSVTFTVKDATVESVTFTATDETDGVALKQTATVNFTGPPATAGGVGANPISVAADGKSSTTITVMLLDAHGRGTPNKLRRSLEGRGSFGHKRTKSSGH